VHFHSLQQAGACKASMLTVQPTFPFHGNDGRCESPCMALTHGTQCRRCSGRSSMSHEGTCRSGCPAGAATLPWAMSESSALSPPSRYGQQLTTQTPFFAWVAVISLQAIITVDGSCAGHLFCIDLCWCCLLPRQMAYSLLLSPLSIPQANSALLGVLSESNKLTELGRRNKRFSRPRNSIMSRHLAPAASTDGAWCTQTTSMAVLDPYWAADHVKACGKESGMVSGQPSITLGISSTCP